jgi:nucleoside-diphosphate-sugar epimerase
LRSGKPIVATNLLTHTQVLTPAIARLVAPEAQPFAHAVLELIEQPEQRARLSAAARVVAQEKYSRESYVRRTAQALGVVSRVFRFPVGALRVAAGLFGKGEVCERLCGSLAVDCSKTRQLLGWSAMSSVDDELRRTVEWYRRRAESTT